MRIRNLHHLALLVAGLAAAGPAAADSYRCGRQLVRDGDSVARLLRLCGEPHHRDRGTERLRVDGRDGPQRVQRWYYRRNSRSLEYVVLIHRGRVAAIEVGRR
jgi:hypothetical protein